MAAALLVLALTTGNVQANIDGAKAHIENTTAENRKTIAELRKGYKETYVDRVCKARRMKQKHPRRPKKEVEERELEALSLQHKCNSIIINMYKGELSTLHTLFCQSQSLRRRRRRLL